jgi:hypothetical protein
MCSEQLDNYSTETILDETTRTTLVDPIFYAISSFGIRSILIHWSTNTNCTARDGRIGLDWIEIPVRMVVSRRLFSPRIEIEFNWTPAMSRRLLCIGVRSMESSRLENAVRMVVSRFSSSLFSDWIDKDRNGVELNPSPALRIGYRRIGVVLHCVKLLNPVRMVISTSFSFDFDVYFDFEVCSSRIEDRDWSNRTPWAQSGSTGCLDPRFELTRLFFWQTWRQAEFDAMQCHNPSFKLNKLHQYQPLHWGSIIKQGAIHGQGAARPYRTRQSAKHFYQNHIQSFSLSTTSTDRVPEVHGVPRCTVGPYGLPNRHTLNSQAPGPCLFLFARVNCSRCIRNRPSDIPFILLHSKLG